MKYVHFLCAMIVCCSLFGALVDPTAGVDPDAPVVVPSIASASALVSSEDGQDLDQREPDIMCVYDDRAAGSRDGRYDFSDEEASRFDGWHGGRCWGRGDDEDDRSYDGQEDPWSDSRPNGMCGPRRWRGGRGHGFMRGRGRAWGRDRVARCDGDGPMLSRWHNQDDDQQPRNFRGRMERRDVMRFESDNEDADNLPVALTSNPYGHEIVSESVPIALAVTSHVESATPVVVAPDSVVEATVTATPQATMAPVL